MKQSSPPLPVIANKARQSSPPPPVIANKVKQSSLPHPVIASEAWQSSPPSSRHCERSEAIQHPAPRHCERSEAIQYPWHQIWGAVLPFRPPRASNLGVRFTLPTTPSIKSEGHFHLPDSSEVKFGGHSCITDLSDTLIWGSFLLHRPTRHPNLGVKLPVPHKLHTPLLPKPTSQSESPHLFFTLPRGNHRESSTISLP